jgi:hypothetical protein
VSRGRPGRYRTLSRLLTALWFRLRQRGQAIPRGCQGAEVQRGRPLRGGRRSTPRGSPDHARARQQDHRFRQLRGRGEAALIEAIGSFCVHHIRRQPSIRRSTPRWERWEAENGFNGYRSCHRALAHDRPGKFDEALAHCGKAVEFDPGNFVVGMYQATVLELAATTGRQHACTRRVWRWDGCGHTPDVATGSAKLPTLATLVVRSGESRAASARCGVGGGAGEGLVAAVGGVEDLQ